MDFPQNAFVVFLNLPLLRNPQKRHKKKKKERKRNKTKKVPTYLFSGYLPDIRRFQLFFLKS
jgi:hypothetical protein